MADKIVELSRGVKAAPVYGDPNRLSDVDNAEGGTGKGPCVAYGAHRRAGRGELPCAEAQTRAI